MGSKKSDIIKAIIKETYNITPDELIDLLLSDKTQDSIREARGKVDEVSKRLGVPLLFGEVQQPNSSMIIRLDKPEQLTRDLIQSDGLALLSTTRLCASDFVEHMDNPDTVEKVVTMYELHVRQSVTSTWFRVIFMTSAMATFTTLKVYLDAVKAEKEEELEESEYWEEEEDSDDSDKTTISEEDAIRLANSAAYDEGFWGLKNQQDRQDYIFHACRTEGHAYLEEGNWGWGGNRDKAMEIASLAHQCVEYGVLPRKCQKLEKDGNSVSQIMRNLGMSRGRIQRYLKAKIPDHIKAIIDGSPAEKAELDSL